MDNIGEQGYAYSKQVTMKKGSGLSTGMGTIIMVIQRRIAFLKCYVAGRLNKWTAGIQNSTWKWVLLIFCGLSAATYSLVVASSLNVQQVATCFTQPPAYKPLHIGSNVRLYQRHPTGVPQQIHSFRHFVDSLRQTIPGQHMVDSLLMIRPGLFDSLNRVEDMYRP